MYIFESTVNISLDIMFLEYMTNAVAFNISVVFHVV